MAKARPTTRYENLITCCRFSCLNHIIVVGSLKCAASAPHVREGNQMFYEAIKKIGQPGDIIEFNIHEEYDQPITPFTDRKKVNH